MRQVEQQILSAMHINGRPFCVNCLALATRRSRSGVKAACDRLVSRKILGQDRERTCPQCRNGQKRVYWLITK